MKVNPDIGISSFMILIKCKLRESFLYFGYLAHNNMPNANEILQVKQQIIDRHKATTDSCCCMVAPKYSTI